jgi:hypothetical protein
VIRTVGNAGSTKETNNKKALKIAEEFERAARTKQTLKQIQIVLGRLSEKVSGAP